MKLKSLILGSVAAAGLSTAGYAADLGVLTSLDVCDSLGLSGLTISSDTNCLQISGEVIYEFNWGDYDGDGVVSITPIDVIDVPLAAGDDDLQDWESNVEAWLTIVGTADSDFGPAKAVIKIGTEDDNNEVVDEIDADPFNDNDTTVFIDEAYVAVGDSTVLMAGRKGSIAVDDDDEPFNYLGLFGSEAADDGVWYVEGDYLGGHVIQVVSDLGNGVSVSAGLEGLEGEEQSEDQDGSLVGVVSYAGESLTAHLTGVAVGVLDGEIDEFAVHAGATGTFDIFKIRGAVGYNHVDDGVFVDADTLNALVSAEATFDMFTVAASAEYVSSDRTNSEGWGFGASIGAEVTDGISINLGGRYFDLEDNTTGVSMDSWQIGAQLVAAVTETIDITGEIGVYGGEIIENNVAFTEDQVYYGAAELGWNPGGDFEASLRGEVHSTDAYQITFEASKSFE